ncbi:prolyl oligopeptidase family serine peptidase [Kangiella shandongensis]|uniref:prolyl oligopeptidase family serine peptidase n=1 Tax=Kangiella shandongensis TaxID=2763258 RepID=UPI001CBAE6A7|nr:prolyl oligopeptidase family serine peptidase [Kangiella shandongensis]
MLILKIQKTLLFLAWITLLSSCSEDDGPTGREISTVSPNQTRDFSYKLHDVEIHDPYRWLEEKNSQERRDWLSQQQQVTQQYFSQFLPEEKERQTTSAYHILFPKKLRDRLYYLKQSTQNKKLSVQRWNLESNKVELEFELSLTEKKPIASSLSPGARYFAILWQLPDNSSELNDNNQYQWQLFDLANRQFIEHELPITQIKTHLEWLEHNRALLLSTGKQVVLQKLLPKGKEPQLIFDPARLVDKPSDWEIDVELATDHTALIIKGVNPQANHLKFWVKDLQLKRPYDAKELIHSTEPQYQYVGSHGNTFYFQTTLAASRGRIISVDKSQPSRQYWKEVIGQRDDVLLNAELMNNEWLLHYVNNTRHQWFISRLNGTTQTQLDIPEHAQTRIEQLLTHPYQVLLSSSTLSTPHELYQLDFVERNITALHSGRQQLGQLKTKVLFFRSNDGSRIPITLYSKHAINKSDANKILITTHQGLGQHFVDRYHFIFEQWLEHNGIIAVPHIRGGGTYGFAWQKATSSSSQLKAAEDINSAVRWLVDKNYSSAQGILGYGRDNSATFLLQAAILSPENWSALVLQNPTADFINYYQNDDKAWLRHLAIAPDTEGITKLLGMSPYHNFPQGSYPTTLLIGSNQSDELLKLAALWQNQQLAKNPILLMKADHTKVRLNDSDWSLNELIYQFLLKNSGLSTVKPLNKKAL